MKKNTATIITILSILLIITYTITSTYSVIINVTNKEGTTEIINKITLKDLLINDDGSYNYAYYNVKNTLNITESEANLLMESIPLNNSLEIVLNAIVDYKLHGKNKMNNNDIYELIIDSTNKSTNFNDELKNKVITNSYIYIQEVSDYLYDTQVSIIEGTK